MRTLLIALLLVLAAPAWAEGESGGYVPKVEMPPADSPQVEAPTTAPVTAPPPIVGQESVTTAATEMTTPPAPVPVTNNVTNNYYGSGSYKGRPFKVYVSRGPSGPRRVQVVWPKTPPDWVKTQEKRDKLFHGQVTQTLGVLKSTTSQTLNQTQANGKGIETNSDKLDQISGKLDQVLTNQGRVLAFQDEFVIPAGVANLILAGLLVLGALAFAISGFFAARRAATRS